MSPVADPGVRGDLHDGRFQPRLGDEALFVAVPAEFHRWAAAHPVGRQTGDREGGADARCVALRPDHGARCHALALGEDVIDDEAGPRRARRRRADARCGRPCVSRARSPRRSRWPATPRKLIWVSGDASGVPFRGETATAAASAAPAESAQPRRPRRRGERRARIVTVRPRFPASLVHLRLLALAPPPAGLAVEPSRRQCHEHGRRERGSGGRSGEDDGALSFRAAAADACQRSVTRDRCDAPVANG